ncbi:MAG: 50S ribosomal protein L29 [Armatimonadetes bacterium]|nr:50S ribosomal protein L29 [Armatimonadota bacterium]MDW8153592.1 50S ribosomal protein L29 [Armatimonadota bacterium]
MKAQQMRELSMEELQRRLDEALQEAFRLRVQIRAGKAQNPSRLREVRRDIARLKTVLAERGVRV